MHKWSKACLLFLLLYLDLNSQTWLWLHSSRKWLETIHCFWVLELKTVINDIDYLRLSFLKGPSSVRRRSVTVSKAALQKLPRDRVERIWASPSVWVHPWTKPKWWLRGSWLVVVALWKCFVIVVMFIIIIMLLFNIRSVSFEVLMIQSGIDGSVIDYIYVRFGSMHSQ